MDLPLVALSTDEDGVEVEELDMGVVLYSCSFAVIFLMILAQVTSRHGGLEEEQYSLRAFAHPAPQSPLPIPSNPPQPPSQWKSILA